MYSLEAPTSVDIMGNPEARDSTITFATPPEAPTFRRIVAIL